MGLSKAEHYLSSVGSLRPHEQPPGSSIPDPKHRIGAEPGGGRDELSPHPVTPTCPKRLRSTLPRSHHPPAPSGGPRTRPPGTIAASLQEQGLSRDLFFHPRGNRVAWLCWFFFFCLFPPFLSRLFAISYLQLCSTAHPAPRWVEGVGRSGGAGTGGSPVPIL